MINRSVPYFLYLLVAQTAWAASPDMTATVTGTVNEPVQSVTVTTEIGSVSANVSGTSFSAASVPLAVGPNVITVTAKDLAGNSASASVTVQVHKTFTIRGTVADESAVTVVVNGVSASVASGVFTADVPLPLGLNPVTAVATDASNNAKSVMIDVFIARKPVDHP